VNKKIYDVEIKVTGDEIFLSQGDSGHGESIIVLSADQAEVVSRWLLEAKAKVEQDAAAAEYDLASRKLNGQPLNGSPQNGE